MMTGLSQSEEDYLETLYMIQLENRVIRVKDVADAKDVTMPSVVAAIRSLSEKGMVQQEKYGHIELTVKGKKVGKDVYERHKLLFSLLHEVLGLDPAVAEEDACRMEHHLSPETRERMLRIVEFTRACRHDEANFLTRFMSYVSTGKMPDRCRGCTEC